MYLYLAHFKVGLLTYLTLEFKLKGRENRREKRQRERGRGRSIQATRRRQRCHPNCRRPCCRCWWRSGQYRWCSSLGDCSARTAAASCPAHGHRAGPHQPPLAVHWPYDQVDHSCPPGPTLLLLHPALVAVAVLSLVAAENGAPSAVDDVDTVDVNRLW